MAARPAFVISRQEPRWLIRKGCEATAASAAAARARRHVGAIGFFFPTVQRSARNPPLARSGASIIDLVLALLAFWLVLEGAPAGQEA